MPTRTLTRPVVLMLSHGWMRAYCRQHPAESAPPRAEDVSDFGVPETFVPQKVRALKRAKLLALASAVIGALGVAVVLIRCLW
jgi:hypothetical protein